MLKLSDNIWAESMINKNFLKNEHIYICLSEKTCLNVRGNFTSSSQL